MINFILPFFLKISETLKAHIPGTETDILNFLPKGEGSSGHGSLPLHRKLKCWKT